MCGILAYIGSNSLKAEHKSLTIIKHRGPDGFGMKSFKLDGFTLSLGHRRLSILDLNERAAQPLNYYRTGLWITYNGEIYNYVELKKQLHSEGYKFFTTSDTEVLLAAYHKWGIECLNA